MKSFATKWIALTFTALLATAPVLSRAQTHEAIQPDYSVFLDPPTGFVFVKLPKGWKFVGKVDAGDATKIPPQVLTSVLGPDPYGEDASSGKVVTSSATRP